MIYAPPCFTRLHSAPDIKMTNSPTHTLIYTLPLDSLLGLDCTNSLVTVLKSRSTQHIEDYEGSIVSKLPHH